MIRTDKLVEQVFNETLFTITTEKQKAIVSVFIDWLTKEARLKPVADLQERLLKMEPKLRRMAKNITVTTDKGQLVVKSDAESETLLRMLRYGSNWFEPHPDVNAAIMLGLLNGS